MISRKMKNWTQRINSSTLNIHSRSAKEQCSIKQSAVETKRAGFRHWQAGSLNVQFAAGKVSSRHDNFKLHVSAVLPTFVQHSLYSWIPG